MAKLHITLPIISIIAFFSLYVTSPSYAQVSQAQCQLIHNGTCDDVCDPATHVAGPACTSFAGTYVCCVPLTAGPPVPPPVPGAPPAVPDTNCPVDSTYVALTDSCISVGDFNNFLFNLLILAGVLVAIYRATTGFFMFMTAEGNPEKLKGGREALTQAMVGLLIVVAGWVFIRLFETILPDTWNIILTGA